MASETPSPAFEHDPLPDSTTHFRLLHILRGDFGQHVECELSSWPIDDAPSYYAISYTWGDPADTSEITVNGKPLIVRRNCEYVLQQAFATKASRYYWVDAICIAQMNIQERNHQVGIMGKIYSGAKHVFACVGPHADDSEYLMATVDQQRPILETVHQWGKSDIDYDFVYTITEHMRRQLRRLFIMRASERLRTSEAFVAFIRRPYFKRVWVLQELHLATRMSYCCGAEVQPGESFRALDSLVEYWIQLPTEDHSKELRRYQEWIQPRCIHANTPSKELWSVLRGFYPTIEPSRICLRLGVSAQKRPLDVMLTVIHDFNCMDTRDFLYGILSLVQWPEGQGPTPDYQKDNFGVAKHVLSLWCRDHELLSFTWLCFQLFRLFDVTSETVSLRHAIALRSNVIPQADFRIQSNRIPQIANVSTIWSGVQISDDDLMHESIGDGKQPGPNSCYMERERHGRFIWIQTSSMATVRAPVDTKVGDWCLTEGDDLTYEDACTLIVRESNDGRYLVVGPALADHQNDQRDVELGNDSRSVRIFAGWLDIEDMMILAWTLQPFTARQDVSDKEIEELVNMRVCGWKDSSYFERIPDNLTAHSSYV